jgi:NADPH:quinone reductase-like Zn-dependent oxidoreductase
MMRLQYDRYGGPDVLTLGEAEIPTPGRGQVLVRVRAAAANAMDWKIRRGEMRAMTGRRFPRGVGHDFSGVIAQVGDGVSRLKVGDEVLGAARLQHAGAFAEFVIADQKSVAHKPGTLARSNLASTSSSMAAWVASADSPSRSLSVLAPQ